MTKHTTSLLVGGWVLIALLACGSGEQDERAQRDPGSGRGRDSGPAGSDPKPDPMSTMPSLCPSCDPNAMPGGDTTDFGAGTSPPCAGRFDRRDLTLEQVEDEVLELDADLERAEGRHEFVARWQHLKATTSIVVEIERTGRARLQGWENDPPDDRPSELPRCPDEWTVILPEVEVRVTTADHSVEGVFTGWLETQRRPVLYPPNVEWERDEPWWLVTGDGSSLHGSLQFAGTGEPAALEVSVAALDVDGDPGVRGGLTLSWYSFDQSVLPMGGDPWTVLEPVRSARPLDGCMPFERTTDPDTCDPWNERGCCMQRGERVDYVRPSDPDEDAGVP